MNTQRFGIVVLLTVVNLVVLGFTMFRGNSNAAPEAPAIVRVRALELVDDKGRVRAELKVMPAQPDFKMPDGSKGSPEAVQLRLITSKGGPNVKLAATEDGAGLVVGGEDSGYVQILSRGTNAPFVKVVTKDGREQTLRP